MLWRSPTAKNLLLRCWGCNKNKEKGDKSKIQNGKSRIKRVASAIIAGVMALQTVAPVISYADDTASSVATTDDSDAIANVDPGTPVQVDATASEEPSEAPSSGASQADENSEETETNSDITDEVANEHTDADTADETQTVEEDAPKQDESTSETTDTAPSRTVTVTLNKNGGEFEPEWLETANEDPIAAYLGTETNDIVVEDTGDTIVATVTDRDSIDIPVALSSDESLYFTGWDVSSGSYNADSETLTFEDGVDAYVLSAVYSSVVDDDQTLVENRTEFDEQTKRQAIQDGLRPDTIHIKLVSNGIAKDAYLDADSNWHLEFDGLPKYRDHGILNEYSVQEVDVDGYTSTVTTEDGYAFTIKNDHVPAVIDIPITEEWIDDNNRDGLRPSSHTVILTDGINTIEEIVLDKDNGYGTVLKDMPKYKNGVEIDYQIKDFKVDGYTTNIIKGDSVKDFKVTNTHVPEMVTVTVTEGWHDQSDYDKIRPEEIALTLTGSDGNVYEKTVNKETWTAVFSDLPKNSKGEQIIYTLTQEGIKGYSTTITNNQTDTITVINKHEPVKAITVTVTWNDENNKDSIRPDKVTVKLTDGTTVVSTKEVKNDSWKHIFEDIPVFNGSDKVSYTITQDAVNGYTTEIKASDDGNTIEIINTHIPVVPPKEEPKKEEPATPAPVVEVKVEQPAPTVTLIQTTNKPTGISFFESLFAK